MPLSSDDIQRRLGKVTGCRIADVMARSKDRKSYGVTRAAYMAELICERLTGIHIEGFDSSSMQWGREVEEEAIRAFELWVGEPVIPGYFVDHPTIPMAGATPDAFVGEFDLAEFKCPKQGTHMATLKGANLDGGYFKQGQWQLACLGQRKSVYHVSFDPRWPPSMRLAVKRVWRDEAVISELEAEAIKFLRELDTELAALRQAYEPGALMEALKAS